MNKPRPEKKNITEILVFKTSLQTPIELKLISGILNNTSGIEEWSVDLDDWEKILRIESGGITAREVNSLLWSLGILSREIARVKL